VFCEAVGDATPEMELEAVKANDTLGSVTPTSEDQIALWHSLSTNLSTCSNTWVWRSGYCHMASSQAHKHNPAG
jgi:hypothetical protein